MSDRRSRGFGWVIILSLLFAAVLFVPLVRLGTGWTILSETRILAPLIKGGIIALTDTDNAFISGLAEHSDYVEALSPIDWEIVLLAMAMFALFFILKGVQLHTFARFTGVPGTRTDHIKSYIFGQGADRLLPFNFGRVATASALEGYGATKERAAVTTFLGQIFLVFEVVVFSIICLTQISWALYLRMMFWPLALLGLAYLFTRRRRNEARQGDPPLAIARVLVRQVLGRPKALARMIVLSLVAFGLEVLIVYAISHAFTSDMVFLFASGWLLMLSIVGGYVARMITVTPGGIGQWEWGMVAVLYIGGMGAGEAVTVAILNNFFRYVVLGALFGITVLWRQGIPTTLSAAYARLTGVPLGRERGRRTRASKRVGATR